MGANARPQIAPFIIENFLFDSILVKPLAGKSVR